MEKELGKYKIDWGTVNNMLQFEVSYDDESDIMLMQSRVKRPAVSIDLNGEAWIRVDPQTGEIVGVEIEGFQEVFLRNHPEFFKTEAVAKPITDFVRRDLCPA